MEDVAIVSAVRTPVGKFNGALAPLSAVDLGRIVIKEAIERAGIRGSMVEEVIMGNVLEGGLGQNPARQAACKAGVPIEASAYTINKVCGSGLKAVILAAQAIMIGDEDIVVAGGMESMSNAPYLLNSKVRRGAKMGNGILVDSMIHDGLWCAFNDYHMGITAENIAEKYKISREEQDAFAIVSQRKAITAIDKGDFKKEIVPVSINSKNGTIVIDTDEGPRKGTTLEKLKKLNPTFKTNGSVTAGNSSGINDGAAALVLMSVNKVKELKLQPLAYIRSFASGGVDPSFMGLGPIPATQKALARTNLKVKDLDLIELNEAFAAQSLEVTRQLDFNTDNVNIHGGAIALGHPIGASGSRILVTLLHSMLQEKLKLGLATLCIGGGQGIATIIESC